MSESQLCTMNLWTIVQCIQMCLAVGPRHFSDFQYLAQAMIDWLVETFVKYFQSWVCIKMACLLWPDGKQERWENQLLILHPAFRHSCTWMRLPLGILWAEQSQLSHESPSIILEPVAGLSSVIPSLSCAGELHTTLQGRPHRCWVERKHWFHAPPKAAHQIHTQCTSNTSSWRYVGHNSHFKIIRFCSLW